MIHQPNWFNIIIVTAVMIGACAGLVSLMSVGGTVVTRLIGYVKGRLMVRRLMRMLKRSRNTRMATMGRRPVVEEPHGEVIDKWIREQFTVALDEPNPSLDPMATAVQEELVLRFLGSKMAQNCMKMGKYPFPQPQPSEGDDRVVLIVPQLDSEDKDVP